MCNAALTDAAHSPNGLARSLNDFHITSHWPNPRAPVGWPRLRLRSAT